MCTFTERPNTRQSLSAIFSDFIYNMQRVDVGGSLCVVATNIELSNLIKNRIKCNLVPDNDVECNVVMFIFYPRQFTHKIRWWMNRAENARWRLLIACHPRCSSWCRAYPLYQSRANSSTSTTSASIRKTKTLHDRINHVRFRPNRTWNYIERLAILMGK